MPPDLNFCYEFGGFVLIPKDRLLLHLNQSISLSGKDFDILLYLIERPSTLIQTKDLAEAIWGLGSQRHERNISNHIAKIRKAIGCDPRNPKFIKTIHGKEGYRFIAPVEPKEFDEETNAAIQTANALENSSGRIFEISSHLLTPVYLGSDAYKSIHGPVKENQWIKYKEFLIDKGRLCVLPSGFGVWHISQTNRFSHIQELAEWRKKQYDDILHGRHVINVCMRELLSSSKTEAGIGKSLGVPGYVLSVVILDKTNIKREETIRNILELLSSPTSLESKQGSKDETEKLNRLEQTLLERGLMSPGIEEFGLSGVDIGFASWDGVSYFQLKNEHGLQESLVEFEIAVQSLWWMCKYLADLYLSNDSQQMRIVRKYIPELKQHFTRIKNISATESPSRRTMAEAILNTSRLKQIVEAAIGLCEQKGQ